MEDGYFIISDEVVKVDIVATILSSQILQKFLSLEKRPESWGNLETR